MSVTRQRSILAGCLLLALACGTGCNVLSVPAFLFGPESKRDAELKKLAADDKEKEVRIVILTYAGLETRPEFLRVDRELTGMLVRWLEQGFTYNKERVTIVPPRQVEKFKDENPKWQTMDLVEIGKNRNFDADYVVYLEINSLTLYEAGSGNQLYRGRTKISVAVADVNKPEEDPVKKEFSSEYPSEAKGPVPVGDSSLQEFRQAFLNHVTKKLSWNFTSHPTDSEYGKE